ncbi:MAG: stability/partitioning determinant [Oxalobacteraceae bacterium]|nr:MAG: stability/partitioning determinant [Oxalobacteraceae bacterium]
MTIDKSRQSLGFGDELEDLDPAAWAKPAAERVKPEEAKKAAEAAGFRSREPALPAPVVKQRRRRTGRNAQFNLKTTPETIEAFTRIADAQGWGLGEAFEKATALLERETSKG